MKAQVRSLRNRVLILLSVLTAVALIYTVGTAHADDSLNGKSPGSGPVQIVTQEIYFKGGAANGGRSCFNPTSLLRTPPRNRNNRSWSALNISTARLTTDSFQTRLTEQMLQETSPFLTRKWKQKDCRCVKIGGREIQIVDATPDSILLETGHRFSRDGEGVKVDFEARLAIRIDCAKEFGISKTVMEEHDVHVSFLLNPETIPQDSPVHLQRSDALVRERRLLCETAFSEAHP